MIETVPLAGHGHTFTLAYICQMLAFATDQQITDASAFADYGVFRFRYHLHPNNQIIAVGCIFSAE